MIFKQIYRVYNSKLDELLKSMDLFTNAAKNRYIQNNIYHLFNLRLLIDVQFLILRMSSFDNVDGFGNGLEVGVNNMKIKDKKAIEVKGGVVEGDRSSRLFSGLRMNNLGKMMNK